MESDRIIVFSILVVTLIAVVSFVFIFKTVPKTAQVLVSFSTPEFERPMVEEAREEIVEEKLVSGHSPLPGLNTQFSSSPGFKQKGMTIQEWAEYIEKNPRGSDTVDYDIYPRHRLVQPGEYQEELKGNYVKSRFGRKSLLPTRIDR